MTTKPQTAWAPVSRKSGKVLRDHLGQYATYTTHAAALADCPDYGEVRGVSIRVLPRAKDVKGILKRKRQND